MKKIFSLMIALVAALAINATDYYFAGAANGWSANKDSYKFQEVEGVLTLEVADLYGEFKITEDGGWHPQHGAAAAGEGVAMSGSYNLVKCDDSQGEADAPANCNILITDSMGFADPRYKDAKLTLNVSDPDHIVINLVAGSLYDHAAAPIYYYLIGACTNNWSLDDAVKFEDVDGVLTANVAKLEGGFKIIYDRKWGTEYASNGAGVVLGEAYNLQLGGGNLSLANPFASYNNAVLTLDTAAKTLTLVSGEFNVMANYWHIPGSKLGWNLNESTRFELVEGTESTYEFLAAEFGADFKIVYGTNWEVEFGSQKPLPEGETAITWAVNAEPLSLYINGDNLHCGAGDSEVYNDVTITIDVDYEAAAVTITLEVEATAFEQIAADKDAVKVIENGKVIVIKNGVRYSVKGAKL